MTPRPACRRYLWTLMALSVVLGLSAGCGTDGPAQDDGTNSLRLREPNDVLSEPLMLALQQAKNFHHLADVYLKDGNPEQAITTVHKILTIQFPPRSPEEEDVKLDARARLAKLLITMARLPQALKAVNDGIQAAKRESFFLSNLYTAKADVHEALADTGEQDQAATQRRAAIEALQRSISINEKLQQRLGEQIRD